MMDQQLLKNHTIGYNTVSSVDGIINARGVKSKPNNMEIMGYTHEVGEGEKSPDNPYQLVSLDSGNVNLYTPDSVSEIVVTNEGAIRKGIELDVSKFRSGYISIFHTSNIDISDSKWSQKGINIKFFRNGKYDNLTEWCLVLSSRTEQIPEDVSKILLYETNASNGGFDIYQDLTILDSPILPTEPVTDEHSIVLSNGDMSIRVPTPTVLHSVAGKSDILTKKNGSIWGIKVRTSVFNSDNYISTLKYHGESSTGTHVYRIGDTASIGQELKGNISVCISNFLRIMPKSIDVENVAKLFHLGDKKWLFIRYQHSLYPQFSSVEVLKEFLLENPIEIIFPADAETFIPLSDYAQQLLNSFTLQNQNEISIEGLPEIKISGYIQNYRKEK